MLVSDPHGNWVARAQSDGTFVGVGVFADDVVGIPRRIERLTLGDSSFTMAELPTAHDVVTFEIVAGEDSTSIAGVIESSPAGSTFEAFRVTGCDTWTSLGSIPTDFDWRPAPAPGFGKPDDVVPKTSGVQLLGWRVHAGGSSSSTQYRFIHYDGYTVRAWTVSVTHGSNPITQIQASLFPIHADRSDLVAP